MFYGYKIDEVKQADNSVKAYLEEQTELNIEIAKGNGLFVKEAHDRVLFLDIDSNEQYVTFNKHLQLFEDFIDINNIEEYPSKSGNRHIIVPLFVEQPQPVRMLLQAVLGSDISREACNLRRFLYTEDSKILLFMTQDVEI